LYIPLIRFFAILSTAFDGFSSNASGSIDKVGSISRRRRSSGNALKIFQMSFGGPKYSRRLFAWCSSPTSHQDRNFFKRMLTLERENVM